MIARFFVDRLINGRTKYSIVPKQLKEEIRNMLTDEGYGYLVEEE